MKKILAYVLVLFMSFTSACGDSDSVDDEFYKNKMINNLNAASLWLIQEGVCSGSVFLATS